MPTSILIFVTMENQHNSLDLRDPPQQYAAEDTAPLDFSFDRQAILIFSRKLVLVTGSTIRTIS